MCQERCAAREGEFDIESWLALRRQTLFCALLFSLAGQDRAHGSTRYRRAMLKREVFVTHTPREISSIRAARIFAFRGHALPTASLYNVLSLQSIAQMLVCA
jgi:hypothetical protein